MRCALNIVVNRQKSKKKNATDRTLYLLQVDLNLVGNRHQRSYKPTTKRKNINQSQTISSAQNFHLYLVDICVIHIKITKPVHLLNNAVKICSIISDEMFDISRTFQYTKTFALSPSYNSRQNQMFNIPRNTWN